MGELCARFEVNQPDAPGGKGVIYVKSRWFEKKFSLWVTDGLNAWVGDGSEEEINKKAFSWDCTVTEYLEVAEKYLGVQDPFSNYSFVSVGDEARKLCWTLVRDGVQLVSNWRVEKVDNPKEITCDVLDFLMRGSSRLSEELQRKRRSFEQLKAEKDRCLAQCESFRDIKVKFEEEQFRKFVAVLNSKKDKLRELKAEVLRLAPSKGKDKEDEPESEDELELAETDNEIEENDDDVVSKEEIAVEGAEIKYDRDSAATEILPADSPMEDVSSVDPAASGIEIKENSTAPAKETSLIQQPTAAVSDAATLLGGSTYTSAPRKRRR